MDSVKHVWRLCQIERVTEQQLIAQGAYVPRYKRMAAILCRLFSSISKVLGLLFGSIGVFAVAGLLFLQSANIQQYAIAPTRSISTEKLQQILVVQRHVTDVLSNGLYFLAVVILVFAVMFTVWQVYWHPLISASRVDDLRLLKFRKSHLVFRDARRQLTIFFNDPADLRNAELQLAKATQKYMLTTGQPDVADYEFARTVFRKLKPDFDWEPIEAGRKMGE